MKLTRNIVLGIGSIVVLLLAFAVFQAGKRTHTTWKQYEYAKQQLDDIRHAPQVLAQQQNRLKTLRKQAASLQSQTIVISDLIDLSQYLDKLCDTYNIRFVSLPRELSSAAPISTTAFSLEGDLEAILQAIYSLEQTDRIGVVSRFKLETHSYFERGKEKHELIADIRLQRFVNP